MFQLKKHYFLESSRQLPLLPPEHPCAKVHGHSFKVTLEIEGPLNELGWVMDYSEIDELAGPVLKPLDHCFLNDVLENPTTERLCEHIFHALKPRMGALKAVEISETHDTHCRFTIG